MLEYRFEDHAALQLLWLIPLVLFLVWWTGKRRGAVLQQKISAPIAKFLTRSLSRRKRKWKLILQCLTLFFFVISLARPQSGEGKQKAKSEGLEIMIAIDVSNSMLAEDARPSRLELAKREISRFLDLLGGDKVGLIAFAGSAILLSPLTGDKSALKMFLESLTPESVSTQGTDFKRALTEANQALHRGGVDDEEAKVTRVIILASDGEETEKGGLDAAKKITESGTRIYTLGFGTENGGQIPVRDKNGNMIGYKKDRKGQTVVSRFTGDALKALAEAGKGQYMQVSFGGDAVKNLRDSIDRLQKAQYESLEVSNYVEHYQIFLFFGLMFALLEMFLGERKPEGRIWRGRFEVPLD
jgi:Ca-activated chloride channel family protein